MTIDEIKGLLAVMEYQTTPDSLKSYDAWGNPIKDDTTPARYELAWLDDCGEPCVELQLYVPDGRSALLENEYGQFWRLWLSPQDVTVLRGYGQKLGFDTQTLPVDIALATAACGPGTVDGLDGLLQHVISMHQPTPVAT